MRVAFRSFTQSTLNIRSTFLKNMMSCICSIILQPREMYKIRKICHKCTGFFIVQLDQQQYFFHSFTGTQLCHNDIWILPDPSQLGEQRLWKGHRVYRLAWCQNNRSYRFVKVIANITPNTFSAIYSAITIPLCSIHKLEWESKNYLTQGHVSYDS